MKRLIAFFKKKNVEEKQGIELPKFIKQKKNRESFFYFFMLFLTIFGFVFILSSRSLFGDDSAIVDSGIGKASIQKVGNSEVLIVDKRLNTKTGYGEILLRVDQPLTEVGIRYEAIVGENHLRTKVESTLTKVYDQYYLIQLRNVPEKWRQLVVDFGYTSEQKPQLNLNYDESNLEEILKKKKEVTQQITFIFDYRKMAADKTIKVKKADEYIVQVTELEIKNVNKLVEKIDENEKIVRKEIDLLDKKTEELVIEKEYQTNKQKVETDSQILSIENQKETFLSAIKDMHEQRKALLEKREKLIERNRDSHYFNKK